MHTVFKLLWLKDNKPEIWRKAWKFLCFEDLLQYRLGLDPAMGWPLAGRTMLFDVVRHRWSPEILEAVGVREEQLSRPLSPGSVAGIVNPSLACGLGLHPKTIVVAGGHDQTCGALGAGAIEPGVAMYATGTVECITPAFDKPVFSPLLCKNNLCTYDHAFPGMYATVAFNLTGGNLLKWFRDEFGHAEVLESRQTGVSAYELLMKAASQEPSRLLVLPYFTTSGTPHFDARTPGAILGLRLSTRRGELIRALLEGITFEMRLNLEILEKAGIKTTQLRVIGGGAKSRYWNQLKADVLGKPLVTPQVTEAGCMGVAMLSAASTMGTSIRELASSWSREEESYEPNSKLTGWYEERFRLYRELHPAINGLGI
jgi:xylulokinase